LYLSIEKDSAERLAEQTNNDLAHVRSREAETFCEFGYTGGGSKPEALLKVVLCRAFDAPARIR